MTTQTAPLNRVHQEIAAESTSLAPSPSTDVALPVLDDTQAPPSPTAVGAASVEGQVAAPQDGTPAETTSIPAPATRTEAELYHSWAAKQALIDAGDLTVSIDAAEQVASRAVNNRRIAAQQREEQSRIQREVIASTRPDLVAELTTLIAPQYTDDDIARLKADAVVAKYWDKAERAVMAPWDKTLTETLAAFETGFDSPPPEVLNRYAGMTPDTKLAAIIQTAYQHGLQAVPDGFVSKKDHDAALEALRNEQKAAAIGIVAPPASGGITGAGGAWLTMEQIDAMNTNEWLGHPKEWRDAQREHALLASTRSR